MNWLRTLYRHLRQAALDMTQGFMMITHNGLAMIGMVFFTACLALSLQPSWRLAAQEHMLYWLQWQSFVPFHLAHDAPVIGRVTSADPDDLPSQQQRLVQWLSRKYRVAPEPLSAIVAEVFDVAPKNQVDPWLVLSVIAVESNFNPFLQGSSGKLGLMQLDPERTAPRWAAFGGPKASFDPVANVRVGLGLLKDSLLATGKVRDGLHRFAGELPSVRPEDSSYVNRVLSEYQRMVQVSTQVKQVPDPVTPYVQDPVAQEVKHWRDGLVKTLIEWLQLAS